MIWISHYSNKFKALKTQPLSITTAISALIGPTNGSFYAKATVSRMKAKCWEFLSRLSPHVVLCFRLPKIVFNRSN